MTADQHRRKAERIERSLSKCSLSEHEIVIEGAMLAGTHWFNLGLHNFHLTPVAQDVMHAEFLSKADHLKVGLVAAEMLTALEEIERSRALFVRGNAPGGEEGAKRAVELLAVTREAALKAVPIRMRDRIGASRMP